MFSVEFMNDEILRLVDTIHRSKEIDKEIIFLGIEAALLSAVKKKMGESETVKVSIDRRTGETYAFDGESEIEVEDLGRLAAMTGKQVLFQKIREAERDRIFEEFTKKVGTLVSGIVQRMEGPNLIINLGKVEGILPRSEQAPGERFKVGERIKVHIRELRKNTSRVKIILSRTAHDLVKSLFELEVPEVADKVIEIKEIAREPGYRTKIAVTTYDHNVDCVGACVGVRGSRIKNIVDELFGEKIDIVRWNESIEVLIMNALKPAEISSMDLDFENKRAVVYVRAEQQSLAIGKRGQNVRLASKLSGWDLDIVSVSEEELEKLRREDISDEPEEGEGDEAAEATDEVAEATAEVAEVTDEVAEATAEVTDEVAEATAEVTDEVAEATEEVAEAEEADEAEEGAEAEEADEADEAEEVDETAETDIGGDEPTDEVAETEEDADDGESPEDTGEGTADVASVEEEPTTAITTPKLPATEPPTPVAGDVSAVDAISIGPDDDESPGETEEKPST